MAQIGTADVTYTYVDGTAKANAADPVTERVFIIQFGDGTLSYTNGGIPIQKAKLGCPASLASMIILDAGSTVGYVPKWNMTANTVRLYQDNGTAATAALPEILTSAVVTSTTLRVLVKGY